MGAYIHVMLSPSITQEEWTPVYEKSLYMAQNLGFFELDFRAVRNRPVMCFVPTRDTRKGWSVLGSFPSFARAEEQFTPKKITWEPVTDKTIDAINSNNRYSCEKNIDDIEMIWGNKTQHEPYHIGLLAIGCMMEHELGVKAMVGGDITYEQCIMAADIASKLLDTKTAPPTACFIDKLYARIKNMDYLTEEQKLEMIYYTYIGKMNKTAFDFLDKFFPKELVDKYRENNHSGFWSWGGFCRSGNPVFDICSFQDLMFFKPYSVLSPKMKKQLELSFGEYCELSDDSECGEIMAAGTEEMLEFLADSRNSLIFTEKQWEHIFDNIERDSRAFKRYFPMSKISMTEDNKYLTRALVTDDDFWNYCCDNFLKGSD